VAVSGTLMALGALMMLLGGLGQSGPAALWGVGLLFLGFAGWAVLVPHP
jgi:hypothetical protein